MSSPRSVAPLHITPESSRRLAGLLIVAHLAAGAVLLWSGLPVWAMAALAALIGGSLYFTFRQHVLLQGRNAITKLIWQPSGGWTVRNAKDVAQSARLRAECFVHPWLVILNLGLEDGTRRALVLLPDSLAPETMRILRVRLHLENGREVTE